MRTLPIVLLLLSTGPALAGPAQPAFHCHAQWNFPTDGSGEKKFDLVGTFDFSPVKSMRLQLGHRGELNTIRLEQPYGKQEKVSYELQCSDALNCEGGRTRIAGGKTERDPFRIPAATKVQAYLGAREVFRFERRPHSFHYTFVQYRRASGQEIGLEVDCHD